MPTPTHTLAARAALALLLAAPSALSAQASLPVAPLDAASSREAQETVFPPRRKFEHRFRVEARYDGFTDSTRVSASLYHRDWLGSSEVNGNLTTVSFAFPGRTPVAPPDSVTLMVQERWVQFQRLEGKPGQERLAPAPRPVHVLVDDSLRFADTETGYELLVPVVQDPDDTSNATQTVTATFSLRQLLAMAAATRVAMRVGNDDFTLNEGQLEALRDLASWANPAAWASDPRGPRR